MADYSNISGVSNPINSINVSMNSYKPTNSLSSSGSSSLSNKSLSTESIDLDDFLEKKPELEEYETTEINDSENNEKSCIEKFVSCRFSRCMYTYGNFMLALNDGAVQLTEKIADGAIWSTKELVGAHMWLASKVVSLFNPELGKEFANADKATQDFFKNIISFSATNWWRNLLSDNDGMRMINEYSYLEYGGEKSKKISDVSEKIQTKIGAAISSKVWGGCLALLLGGCYGSGEQAEKLYSTKDETGVREELSILFSGGEEAMKWFTIAKLTQGITSAFKGSGSSLFGNGDFGAKAKDFGQRALSNFKETNAGVFKSFKNSGVDGLYNPFCKYLGDFFENPYNTAKTFQAFSRNFDDYFSGEKEFTIGSMLNDIIFSASYMLSGAMRLNIMENGDENSMPQFGLTYLTARINDWINKKLGIEDIDAHHGGGGGHGF